MSKAKKIISVFLIFVVLLIGGFTVSADTLESENYVVYTKDLGAIFGNGQIAYQRTTGEVDTYSLNLSSTENSYMWSPHFASNQTSNGYTATNVTAQPTWVLSKDLFNGSKQYLFDFYLIVWAREDISYVDLDSFRFSFGTFNVKRFKPIEYIPHSNSSVGYVHFKFVLDGQILSNTINAVNFDFNDFNSKYRLTFGLPKHNDNRGYFTIKEYTEAEQVLDEEEDRANKGGNDSVNELGSVIPNDSGGFIDSLSNFVGAMAYDGTECNWEFPALYLPAIQGVMPKINLTDELEIPFEYWISKIPSGILTLVRSLLTIALIVFCFKELYNIISYVLTLRGGASNE